MRSWGSTLQGRPEGEKTGSQLGQPRTQARLRRCPARGVASVLTTDVGHPATSPVLVAVRSLTQQAPGACPVPAEQRGVEGSMNAAERERGIDGPEGDQGKCHGPEGFLQPIGFGSPFAGWSRRPVHSTAPGKTKQKHLLILSVALRPPGCASPRSIDSGARLLHASAPPSPRGALGGQPSPRLRSRNSECANRPGRRPRPAARITAYT